MQSRDYSIEIGGKTITATFSDLADQAAGSVMLSCDNTIVLATAWMSKDGKNNPGFFNLTVEYQERFYASGLILGGQYNKREGRPSDEAILSARIIDRTIRPLFSSHIKNAVQVVVTVLSVGDADPGVLGVNAASLAIATSSIPWMGPVGAVLVSQAKDMSDITVGQYIPNTGETPYQLDLTVCGREGKVMMIEALAYEYDEAILGDAFDRAMAEISKLEHWQKEIVGKEGKEKLNMPKPETPESVKQLFAQQIGDTDAFVSKVFVEKTKAGIAALEDAWNVALDASTLTDEEKSLAKDYLHHKIDEAVHIGATRDNKRVDGRAMDEVRELYGKAGGFSPIVHGSGIFYRGQTHVMSFLTLAGPDAAQAIEGMEVRGTKRFSHHYNFPPYSVGETGRFGGINRREMGHGFLAEKALIPVIPEKTVFPYTIRVVSECMASNGSTSQASICASTLALMDGGVPIIRPVAGIAMGVMIDEHDQNKYKILTDIQGPEDHHGDMDFKVAGTSKGVTALQLDIKVDGVSPAILKEALVAAKKARLHILETITATLPAPRADISPNAPKILMLTIKVDQIGLVIGGGGKTVKAIREQTGAEITIEDDGTVYVTGKNGAAEKALAIIQDLTREFKEGEMLEGEVVKILEIGAIVKLNEHTDGLVHISELAPWRVMRVTDLVKEGMRVPVKVVAVDNERGRISLSIKSANPDFFPKPVAPAPAQPPQENK